MISLYIKLVLSAAFWGGAFVAGKMITREVGPYSAAFLRFVIASAMLLVLTWRIEGKLPKVKGWHIIGIIVLGMTGIFSYNVCFFMGLKLIEASRASVIIANNPVLIALLSCVFFKEKLTLVRIIGIGLSVFGAIIVVSKGDIAGVIQGGVGRGEMLIFCCVLSWVTYSLVGKTMMDKFSPLVLVTYSSIVGTAALAIPAFYEGVVGDVGSLSGMGWLSIVYLSVMGTVIAFVWFYQGVQRIGPTRAGLFINFVPIFAVLLSFVLLKEPLTISLLAGVVAVSIGVYLTNKKTDPLKVSSA